MNCPDFGSAAVHFERHLGLQSAAVDNHQLSEAAGSI